MDSPKVLKRKITSELRESRERDIETVLDNYRDNLRDHGVTDKLCFFLYRHPDCTMIIRVRHFSVYTVIPLYRGVSAQLVIRISG